MSAASIGQALAARIDAECYTTIAPSETIAEVIAGGIRSDVNAQLDEPSDNEVAILDLIARDRGEPLDALLADREVLAERVRAAVRETLQAWVAEHERGDTARPTAVCQWCDHEVRWAARTEQGFAGFVHVASGVSTCPA
jgi:hypothetical protein